MNLLVEGMARSLGGGNLAGLEDPVRPPWWGHAGWRLGVAAAVGRARPQGPSVLSEHLGLLPTKHSPSPPPSSISTHIYQLIISWKEDIGMVSSFS